MRIALSPGNQEKVERMMTRLRMLRAQGVVTDPVVIFWNAGDDAVLLTVHDHGQPIGLSTTVEPEPGSQVLVAEDVADALRQAGWFDRYGVRYEVQAFV